MNNRFKDHTQILIYGFASSLLAAVLLFTVVAVSATREAGRIIREAEENNPSRQNTVVPDKDNREGKTDEKENGEAQSGNASEQASKGESGDGTLSPEEQEAEADSTAPTENSTPVPYQGAEIRSLDASEIAAIESTYDLALRGFGTGFNDPKDDYNRSAYVVDVQNDLNAAGIRGRCFVSDVNEKKIALTFQAGYENGYEESILNVLKDQGIKATFYVTHEFADHSQDIIRRMISEGHELGSHTYSAPEEGIALFSLTDQMNDAVRMQRYMEETFGYSMRKYNYNSGIWSLASAKMMSDMGYEVAFCSVNYNDYDPSAVFEPNATLNSLLSCAHNGCVYCFHMTNKITLDILPGLIYYLRLQGYEIVQF